MEARRHVKFTGDSNAVATVDQINSAYHEADKDPFMAAGTIGSM
jgi:hypothetical protein